MNKQMKMAGYILVAVLGYMLATSLTITTTASLNKHVFLKADGNPRKGEYGTFKYSENKYLKMVGANEPFTKRVACVAGDTLELKNHTYYCNGQYIGRVFQFDFDNHELPQFVFNGIIPENMAFMAGDHMLSGDSRYFGFVDVRTVKKVIPLW